MRTAELDFTSNLKKSLKIFTISGFIRLQTLMNKYLKFKTKLTFIFAKVFKARLEVVDNSEEEEREEGIPTFGGEYPHLTIPCKNLKSD